ncbi:hypothetical protein HC251_24070 [Iamia sp. SCSIO 61187]|uniref:hypothetical protein n=1 Tax=Iamia sp. SCSIO 61187 TaxID=2722752 RepID=UPI001C630EF5|nr:hypothetical protein [Iamia sp. SCSIO 61187]QYG95200.1 hypothetical protein HC251_24070 [Iamia sp. SCSIO 61187]
MRPDDDAIHITMPGEPTPGTATERDRNGCLVERRTIDGAEVIVHFDDLPECDRAVVDGIPCTSAVRTIIDIAPDLCAAELDHMIQAALARGLFTPDELRARCTAPDLARRPGARMVRRALIRLGLGHSR